jgi:hypothetical protein
LVYTKPREVRFCHVCYRVRCTRVNVALPGQRGAWIKQGSSEFFPHIDAPTIHIDVSSGIVGGHGLQGHHSVGVYLNLLPQAAEVLINHPRRRASYNDTSGANSVESRPSTNLSQGVFFSASGAGRWHAGVPSVTNRVPGYEGATLWGGSSFADASLWSSLPSRFSQIYLIFVPLGPWNP